MMDAQLSDSNNGLKEFEEAISAIAGLPAGTFLGNNHLTRRFGKYSFH